MGTLRITEKIRSIIATPGGRPPPCTIVLHNQTVHRVILVRLKSVGGITSIEMEMVGSKRFVELNVGDIAEVYV